MWGRRYGGGMEEMWGRCGGDVGEMGGEMWGRCGGDVGEMWGRCGGDGGRCGGDVGEVWSSSCARSYGEGSRRRLERKALGRLLGGGRRRHALLWTCLGHVSDMSWGGGGEAVGGTRLLHVTFCVHAGKHVLQQVGEPPQQLITRQPLLRSQACPAAAWRASATRSAARPSPCPPARCRTPAAPRTTRACARRGTSAAKPAATHRSDGTASEPSRTLLGAGAAKACSPRCSLWTMSYSALS